MVTLSGATASVRNAFASARRKRIFGSSRFSARVFPSFMNLVTRSSPKKFVPGFWIARHEVTNAGFAAFVAATGYVTLAERAQPVLPGAQAARR